MNPKIKHGISIGLILALFFSGLTMIFFAIMKPDIKISIWLTDANSQDIRISAQDPLQFTFNNYLQLKSDYITINIDERQTFQQMQGFGAAMTDSAAWLLHEILNFTEYQRVMKAIFDPVEGIGMSYLRIPLGSSDCARAYYSYDETPWNLSDFSILYDEQYLIPTLQDAIALNPQLKLIGSPWSAPGWMKTNNNLTDPMTKGLIGGTLNSTMYKIYADYFVEIIKAYKAHGLIMDAITIQNEQFYTPPDYPGMNLDVASTQALVKEIGKAFQDSDINTKIYALDHNWIYSDQAIDILSDAEVASYVEGIAWHGYDTPEFERQADIHAQFPNLSQIFTEVSGLQAYTSFPHNLAWTFHNIFAGSIRNWGEAVMLWNLALDQHGGPTLNGYDGLRGVLTIPNNGAIQTDELVFEGEYYMIGHFSKFISTGARRIESSTVTDRVESVAFTNPDGSNVLILCNLTDECQNIKISWDYRAAFYSLPARAIITCKW